MRKTIKAYCNFFVMIISVILVIYVAFFTDIPTKTGNIIRLKIEETRDVHETYSKDFYINDLGISMNTYYYDRLNDEQKKIYSAIANSVKTFKNEFAIRDYVAGDKDVFATEVSIAIEAFINDHPEVFYLQSQYSSYVVSNFEGNIGYVKLNYTEEDTNVINQKIELMKEKIQEYLKEVEGMSDYEKEVAIHDKLAYTVTYSDLVELPRKYHTVEGTLLEGIGVCDGFTKSLQLIYDAVGIDSIIVLGTLDNNPHAWNLVKLDNEWYNVDITSSRSIYGETGIINHAYFNLTTEKMKRVATFDNEDIIPEANSTKYDYYEHNGYILDETQDIYDQLNSVYQNFKDKEYMEFYFKGNVSDNISTMLRALRNIDTSFLDGTKMYYYNIENAIIIPKNKLN
ncbi:MAG: hypothetical protein J6A15_04435 [Clostridia bacterium]|nr:hypothetical protein [Clostridia bacterium]